MKVRFDITRDEDGTTWYRATLLGLVRDVAGRWMRSRDGAVTTMFANCTAVARVSHPEVEEVFHTDPAACGLPR